MRKISLVLMAMIAAILVFTSCSRFSTERVRRDIDTTGYELQAFYSSGGGKVENQGVLVVDSGGLDLVKLAFGRTTAGSRYEILQRFNPTARVDETLWRMTQYDTSEDIFDIRSASFIVQRLLGQGDTDFVVLKSEMRFGSVLANFVNKLNEQDFEIACLYTVKVGRGEDLSGAELARRSKLWFAKLTYKTVVSDAFSPFGVAILNAKPCRELPANWAQMNESYDEAILLARNLVRDLERNNWGYLSPEQGVLYKVTSNPTRFFDVLSFETPYDGWIELDGKVQRYRIVPHYNIFHLSNFFDWWYGKQNSRNRSLEALVIEFEENGRYAPKAVAYFIKNRWAKNGLYVFDRVGPGETPEAIVKRGYDLINVNIPSDVQRAFESGDIDRAALWFAKQPPFDLAQLNADFAAIVDVVDVTETLYGRSSEGKTVTVQGTQMKHGTYHIRGDPNAVVYFNVILGEHAVEMLDLGYIQPRGGDGIGFISHILRLAQRYNSGQSYFTDAAMLDQRSQEGPEMAREALEYFLSAR